MELFEKIYIRKKLISNEKEIFENSNNLSGLWKPLKLLGLNSKKIFTNLTFPFKNSDSIWTLP